MQNKVIFCDFDGTITKEDAVNKLLNKHADLRWLEIEELWKNKTIGSKECLERQINCIDYFSLDMLNDFVDSIEIDDYFLEFIAFVKENNIEFSVVSDGFDLIINQVLKKYHISGVKVFSNNLKFENNKLIAEFPHFINECETKAGLCKCRVLKNYGKNREIVYIGDGISDICASKYADIIFAKGNLAKHCEAENVYYTFFDDFKTIIDKLNVEYKEKQNAVIG